MIQRFTIKNFKRFQEETVLELDPVTVLIGANNSGKSTILQAFNLFQYCVETTRRRNGDSALDGGLALSNKTVSPDEFGALPVADLLDLWPQGKAKRPITLLAEYEPGTRVGFALTISYNRFSIRPILEGEWAEKLRSGVIRFVPIFSGFLPREEFLTLPARIDRMRLQRHGEIVRNLLWDLRENAPDRWRRLLEILRRLFPDSAVEVDFDIEVDRFVRASYHDDVLQADRDVITAGSGFHQSLQILASVLSPNTSLLLLDEPDAHLHARVQGQLIDIFSDLAKEEGLQFLVATHSPYLLNAAPPGSLRICLQNRIVKFGTDPEQLAVLEAVGAMDRMEIIPLLSNRIVVFVENKSDRKLLELFAQRLWGEKKAREVWRKVSFLYTYQEPISAGVLDLARQVRDLLRAPSLPGRSQPVKFLVLGDRDFRTDHGRQSAAKEVTRKAQSVAYGLDLKLQIWSCNEIENYLLDPDAILRTLDRQAAERPQPEWGKLRQSFEEELDRLLRDSREEARQRTASRIQREDRRLDLTTAMRQADAFLDRSWGNGSGWCDAKDVLPALRHWLQERNLKLRLGEREIVDAMESIPGDIRKALQAIFSMLRVSGSGKTMVPRAGAKAARRSAGPRS